VTTALRWRARAFARPWYEELCDALGGHRLASLFQGHRARDVDLELVLSCGADDAEGARRAETKRRCPERFTLSKMGSERGELTCGVADGIVL
jgi:hypothetical protein